MAYLQPKWHVKASTLSDKSVAHLRYKCFSEGTGNLDFPNSSLGLPFSLRKFSTARQSAQ